MPKPKILVADDDPAILSMVQQILSHEGYLVDCAQDGEQALSGIKQTLPHLIHTSA